MKRTRIGVGVVVFCALVVFGGGAAEADNPHKVTVYFDLDEEDECIKRDGIKVDEFELEILCEKHQQWCDGQSRPSDAPDLEWKASPDPAKYEVRIKRKWGLFPRHFFPQGDLKLGSYTASLDGPPIRKGNTKKWPYNVLATPKPEYKDTCRPRKLDPEIIFNGGDKELLLPFLPIGTRLLVLILVVLALVALLAWRLRRRRIASRR